MIVNFKGVAHGHRCTYPGKCVASLPCNVSRAILVQVDERTCVSGRYLLARLPMPHKHYAASKQKTARSITGLQRPKVT